jgi:hypothetical protein
VTVLVTVLTIGLALLVVFASAVGPVTPIAMAMPATSNVSTSPPAVSIADRLFIADPPSLASVVLGAR